MADYFSDERRRNRDDEETERRLQQAIDTELSFQADYLATFDRAAELKEWAANNLTGELTTLLESCDGATISEECAQHVRDKITAIADQFMATARGNLEVVDARLKRLRGF